MIANSIYLLGRLLAREQDGFGRAVVRAVIIFYAEQRIR